MFTYKFTLRSTKAQRKSTIYLVIYHNGKQNKIPTNIKAYVQTFKNGRCTISPCNSIEVNKDNITTNSKINALEDALLLYYSTTLQNGTRFVLKELLEHLQIEKYMAKNTKTSKRASALLNLAFNKYYDVHKVKDSTLNMCMSWKKCITDWLIDNTDNKVHTLSQSTIMAYQEHLIKQKQGVSAINGKCAMFQRLVNNVLCVYPEFQEYQIKHIKYEPLKEVRNKEVKKSEALTDAQIDKLRSGNITHKHLNHIRLYFLLQCLIGQRQSDLEYIVNHIDLTKDMWLYTPKKTETHSTTAIIEIDSEIRDIVTQLKGVGLNLKIYSQNIKQVALECGLTDSYTYKDVHNQTINTTIDKAITSHWARHTAISRWYRLGYSKEEVIQRSGHTDTTMLDKVYLHQTTEDKIKKAIEAKKRVEGVTTTEQPNESIEGAFLKEIKQVLAYLHINPADWFDTTDIYTLTRLLHDKEDTLHKLGVKQNTIKAIFNEDAPLKDRQIHLQQVIEEIAHNKDVEGYK